MSHHYSVTYKGVAVGEITLSVEGLYYRYEGTLQLDEDNIYRVYAQTPFKQINLGVCRPSLGKWIISGIIAISKLNIENLCFVIHSAKEQEDFIAVVENQPFPLLECLQDCRFYRRGDQAGFVIQSKIIELHE